MPSLSEIIKEKTKRLDSIPDNFITDVEKQQKKVLSGIEDLLNELDVKNGEFVLSEENIKVINRIDAELKKVLLNDEYVKSVAKFASEFDKQAKITKELITTGFGEVQGLEASTAYINLVKRSAVASLIGAPLDSQFIIPVKGLLENAVINRSTLKETKDALKEFVLGSEEKDGKLLRYAKQISKDSFSIADRGYTSILSDFIDAEWFLYAGGELDTTRCFCQERVDKYFHYTEVESWGRGENLGKCETNKGEWAGMILGTNEKTIYSYLGGYNCTHSLVPVSEALIPKDLINKFKTKK